MNYSKFIITTFLFSLILTGSLFSQNHNIKKIAILGFNSESLDRTTLNSAQEILKYEIQKQSIIDAVNLKAEENNICDNIDCAIEAANKLDASHAVLVNILQLGQKLIIQYSLIDAEEEKVLLQDNMTSASIEELDVIMQRIAMSITEFQPIAQTAQIGALTEDETKSPLERNGRRYFGFSFGYLYPETGFENTERSFTMDYKVGAEVMNFDYGLQAFARKGFGVNIYSSYLFSRKDICPYIGLGAGFHWVDEQQYNVGYDYWGNSFGEEKKRGDGFELLVNSGVRLFHTYSMRITINVSYSHTFNDYNNDAVIVTLGFLR